MSHVMPCMEQPCVDVHACYTRRTSMRGHIYNYAWWLLLSDACLSGTINSMNVLDLYEILAQVSHVETTILSIM